jgi:hypothetical protein
MSEAKKKVMGLIKKRQKRNRSYRDKAAKRLGPNGIVSEFIHAMEKVVKEAKGPLDFQTGLELEAGLLHDHMRCVDPDVDVQIVWNREDATEKWQDLQVEGVKITWSRWYLGKNPFSDTEKYIDISQLFLEGYFSDEN